MDKTLEQIIELKKSGLTATRIAEILNKAGLKTVKGKRWNGIAVGNAYYPHMRRVRKARAQFVPVKETVKVVVQETESDVILREIINTNMTDAAKLKCLRALYNRPTA